MTLLTPWGEALDADKPLPEYPRPQLVRDSYVNLNGRWQHAFTCAQTSTRPARQDATAATGPLAVADPTHPPATWEGEIIVPFSPETPLSGVERMLQPDELLWYRRTFTLPRGFGGERVLLHFGAVDQSCEVAVNGVRVGGHTGGFLPFALDITAALIEREDDTAAAAGTNAAAGGGAGASTGDDGESTGDGGAGDDDAGDGTVTHEIVVAVRDVTDASWLSRGKQARKRGGIWYSPQSGIWQTVWLEALPRVAVDGLDLTPRLDERTIDVLVRSDAATTAHAHSAHHRTENSDQAAIGAATARALGPTGADADSGSAPDAAEGHLATVTVRAAGDVVATASITPNIVTRITLDDAHTVRPWSPEDPFLYDVDVTLGDDSVISYVGMRSFEIGPDAEGTPRLLLNGEPYFHAGLLDQGYWSDGWLTAPSDAALEYDVQLAKDLGFTMLRKHIKIEPLRWYYHCDRLGMLVWQDMVNGGTSYNPLIITVPSVGTGQVSDHRYKAFGRADAAGRASFRHELRATVDHLRSVVSLALWVPFNEAWGQFDALKVERELRALDDTRPIDHASGWHDQGGGDLKSLHVYFRAFRVKDAWRRDVRVLALTEYGGYSHRVEGHCWNDREFGYRKYATDAALEAAFASLHDEQIAPAVPRGLAASVYTQLSDVEDEVNGMVTYDRRVVKIPAETVRRVTAQLTAGNHSTGQSSRKAKNHAES
ncbi:glycoside hydrolase family 2 protein [Microbacterium sp. MPKO10]|uniref:glycoside hydrolase family 2 protein n=1 Tax=Microbacterium sp. MPKO10 TaxID=2989818 RepID=UPI0022360893|nr:sugar-binding domain-containing protein [Microbacterium sp. MPKO10]MCW4457181.1 glycoside hydrolase family 2 [Microbacterium sp. MPKO10]